MIIVRTATTDENIRNVERAARHRLGRLCGFVSPSGARGSFSGASQAGSDGSGMRRWLTVKRYWSSALSGPSSPKLRANPRIAQYKRTWHFLRRNTLAMIGLVVILALIGIALYASTLPLPWTDMTPYTRYHVPGQVYVCTYSSGSPPGPDCYYVDPNFPSFVPPTLSLAQGTVGPLPLGSMAQSPVAPQFYNVLDGLLRGADWSLLLSFSIVVSGALIGLVIGAVAGFWGGVVDEVLMRIVDVFLSIPTLFFLIITVSVFASFSVPGLSPFSSRIVFLILAFIVVAWPLYARLVRSQVLIVREQKYVEAARASGAGSGRIVLRHVVPNSLYPVFVQMSLDVGSVPLLFGSLAFLGFLLIVPSTLQVFPEWGSLAAYSLNDAIVSGCGVGPCVFPWWQVLFPGLMLFLFAISLNFFSDGLRDALDPRLRR